MIAGGEVKQSGKEFGKKKEIKKLEKELAKSEKELEKRNEELRGIKETLSSISIQEIRNEIQSKEKELRLVQNELSQFNYKLQSINGKIELFTERINNHDSDTSSINNQLAELNEEEESLGSILSDLSGNYKDQEKEYNTLQIVVNEYQEKFRQEELKFVESRNDFNNNKNEIERIERSINSNERRVEELQKSISDFESLRSESSKGTDNYEKELSEHEIKLNENKKITEEQGYKLNSKQAELDQAINEKNIIEKKLNTFKNDKHSLELRFTELNTKKENIFNQCMEKYSVEPSDVKIQLEEDEEEPTLESLREFISELKEKLAQIGSVNFMALEEYDKENERLQFYLKQTSDLTSAKETLLETIDEINTTATEKFNDTFEKIRVNFKDLFKTLFSEEGECEIFLAGDEDPLESDIQIKAQPPGKKPHSIEMLSGGEKTLTAIALLFAIYLVKPSPFCILDEVDAPLDDANIDRFVKMIKRFSNMTQFLVVTHNKKTMEAADNLYGITMQEEGLSTIVSVQMDKFEN